MVDHNVNEKKWEDETLIHKALKAVPKTKKLALKSKGKLAIKQKDALLIAGAALSEEKTSGSRQDI